MSYLFRQCWQHGRGLYPQQKFSTCSFSLFFCSMFAEHKSLNTKRYSSHTLGLGLVQTRDGVAFH